MSTWFSAFFDNELANDVRNEYLDYLGVGVGSRTATKRLVDDFSEEIAAEVLNERLFWMALAVVQWKWGRLEPRVKAKALKFIRQGGDAESYPSHRRNRRRKVLEQVRAKLDSPQPDEKRVRIAKAPEPLKRIERLWTPGQVVAFRRSSGRFVLLLTEVVDKHRYIGQIPYFTLLNWKGATVPSPARICKLRTTQYVIALYPNKKGEPVPWDRVQRLDVVRIPSGLVRSYGAGVLCEIGIDDCHWAELDSRLDTEFPDQSPKLVSRSS